MNDTSENDGTNPPTPEAAADERTVEFPGHDQEIVRLQKERDQLELQLQRTLADTANMRRRQQKEYEDGRRRVVEGIVQELLPVLDTFSLALQAFSTGADTKTLVEGVRMTQTLLTGALERHGLQEINATGVAFDPARHEAVAVVPAGEVAEGNIVRVLQTGYMLGEHVVRHSRVVVAGPATPPAK